MQKLRRFAATHDRRMSAECPKPMRCVLLRLFGSVAAMSREKDGQSHRAIADGWAVKEGFGGAVTACQHTDLRHDGILGGTRKATGAQPARGVA